jgi:hypothetical protein
MDDPMRIPGYATPRTHGMKGSSPASSQQCTSCLPLLLESRPASRCSCLEWHGLARLWNVDIVDDRHVASLLRHRLSSWDANVIDDLDISLLRLAFLQADVPGVLRRQESLGARVVVDVLGVRAHSFIRVRSKKNQ